MQFTNILKKVAAAALVATAGSAMAVPISVGFNFTPVNSVLTGNNGAIASSTTVSSSNNLYAVNGLDLVNTTNNIGVVGPVGFSLGTQIFLTDPMPLTLGATFQKTFTANSILFTESLTVTSVSIGASSRSIVASGIISCGALCGFEDTTVFFSASYTQNGGPTDQINASFNNSTVPPRTVPEPTSLALVGLALAGLGFGARRRAAK